MASNNDFQIILQAVLDQIKSQQNIDKTLDNIGKNTKVKVPVEIDAVKTQKEAKAMTNTITKYVSELDRVKLSNNMSSWLQKNSAAAKMCGSQIEKLVAQCKTADGVQFQGIKLQFEQLKQSARDAGKLGSSFADTFSASTKKFKDWVIASGSVMGVFNMFRSATNELIEIDSTLTEISKTSDITKEKLKELGNTSFESASKYGKNANDYLVSVQEMNRSGFYGEQGTQMAELSIVAQAAGDMSSDLANDYLLATNAAYKYEGSVEKLNAALDGQNIITNRNSVDMETMALATEKAGSMAAETGVKVDELSAMIGTVEARTKEAGEKVGTGLKSLYANVQNITSKKIVKTMEEAGVAMTTMKDGIETLRTPTAILADLAKVFNELPEGDQLREKILLNIGQKYHMNELSALLSGWSDYEKMLKDYSEGSGSAAEEAQKSANNIQGSLNKLSNTWVDTVQNIEDSDGIIAGVNALNDLLNVVNKTTDALGSLGTISMIGEGIMSAKGLGFVNLDKNGNFSTVIDKFTSGKVTKGTTEFIKSIEKLGTIDADVDIDAIANSFSHVDENAIAMAKSVQRSETTMEEFSTSMKATSSSASALSASFASLAMNLGIMLAINLAIKGLAYAFDKWNVTVEESEQKLDEITNSLADLNAEKSKLTANGTDALTNAEKDRLNYLNERIAAEKELQEIEQRKLYKEQIGGKASDYFDSESDTSKIYKLNHDALMANLSSGFSKNTDESIAEYQSYADKIKTTTEELNSIKSQGGGDGYYTKQLEDDLYKYDALLSKSQGKLQSKSDEFKSKISELQADIARTQAAIDAKDSYGNSLLSESDIAQAQKNLQTYQMYLDTFQMKASQLDAALYNQTEHLDNVAQKTGINKADLEKEFSSEELQEIDAKLTIDKNSSLEDLRDGLTMLQKEADKDTIIIKTTLSDALTSGTGAMDDDGNYESTLGADVASAQSYINSINDAKKKVSKGTMSAIDLATEFGVVGNSTSDINKQLDELADNKLAEIVGEIEQIINSGNVDEDTAKKLQTLETEMQSLKNATSELSSFSLTGDAIGDIEQLADGLDQLDKIYADVYDKESFDWSSILNNQGFEEAFGDLGDSYDSFIETITRTPDDIDACQSAFNDLTTAYIYNSGILDEVNDSTAQSCINFLQEKGIVNAEAIVMNQLAMQKAFATQSSVDLANATAQDIINFISETDASDDTKNSIVAYYLEKQYAAGITLDTSGDVANLMTLISALGGATGALQIYYNALNGTLNAGTDGSGLSGGDLKYAQQMAVVQAQAEIKKIQANIQSAANFTGGATTNKARTPSGSGKSAGQQAATATQQAYSTVIDWISNRIDYLKTKAEKAVKVVTDSFQMALKKSKVNSAMKALNKEMQANTSAYEKYMKLANSVSLSSSYKKKVREGKINIEEITNEDLKNSIDAYEKYYKAAQKCKDANEDLRDSIQKVAEAWAKAPTDKIESVISKYEKAADLYSAKADNAQTADEKNKNIANQISQLNKENKSYKDATSTTKSNLKSASQSAVGSVHMSKKDSKKYGEIGDKVARAVESKKPLSDSLLNSVYNYCKHINSMTWYENCVKYNEALEANQSAKETSDAFAEELKKQKRDLAIDSVNNVKDEYDNQLNGLQTSIDNYNAFLDKQDKAGVSASAGQYRNQIEQSKSKQLLLSAQQQAMKAQLASQVAAKNIAVGDAEYIQMMNTINAMDADILACVADQIEYNKAIDKMDYTNLKALSDLLDGLRDRYSSLVSLAEKHGNSASDSLLISQIKAAQEAIDLFDKKIVASEQLIHKYAGAGGDWGLNLNWSQMAQFISLLKSGNINGVNSFLSAFGTSYGQLSGLQDLMADIASDTSSYYDAMIDAEEYYDSLLDSRISALEKIKNAIEKQNDAEDTALKLEKAKYALEKAKAQKTVKTYNGTEWIYTTNADDVKSAQENYDETLKDTITSKIDEVIDAINQLKDDANLYDDNGNLISSAWGKVISSTLTNISKNQLESLKAMLDAYGVNTSGLSSYIGTFASGGTVTPSSFDSLARTMGEDHIIAVKHNEGVLTPEQNKNWLEMTKALPEVITMANAFKFGNTLPNVASMSNKAQEINIDLSGMNLYEVQDAKELMDDIAKKLPNYTRQYLSK